MSERQHGPTMLVATEALKPPKLRIGRITKDFTLPRTVPVTSLLSGVLGATIGAVIAGGFIGWSTPPLMYGMTVGAGVCVFLVNYSPLKGESLAKWLGLKIMTRRHKTMIDGKPVRLAVGVAYLQDPQIGAVRIVAGAVNVPDGTVDERGVRISDRWSRMTYDERAVSVGHQVRRLPGEDETEPMTASNPAQLRGALQQFRTAREEAEQQAQLQELQPQARRRPVKTRWKIDDTPSTIAERVVDQPSQGPDDENVRTEEALSQLEQGRDTRGWTRPG